MATKTKLVSRVQEIVRKGTTPIQILDYLNQGVWFLTGGPSLPDGRVLAPLPDLRSSGNVTTSTSLAYVAMPTTSTYAYHRKLYFAYSASQDAELEIKDTLLSILQIYPDLAETGSIEYVTVVGANLYYQPIPTSADTLTLHYYRQPVDMADDDDTPDGIPAHLQVDLLVNYAAMKLMGLARDGAGINQQGTQSTMTGAQYHKQEFVNALMALADFIGPEELGPVYLTDTTDYIDG